MAGVLCLSWWFQTQNEEIPPPRHHHKANINISQKSEWPEQTLLEPLSDCDCRQGKGVSGYLWPEDMCHSREGEPDSLSWDGLSKREDEVEGYTHSQNIRI